MVPHSLNVAHSDDSSQVLWRDSECVFHRGWRLDDDGKRRDVLIAFPAADHPSRSMLERFTHEYELKDELDATWAVRRWISCATGAEPCWCLRMRAASRSSGRSACRWRRDASCTSASRSPRL